jgi:hypothetical protein
MYGEIYLTDQMYGGIYLTDKKKWWNLSNWLNAWWNIATLSCNSKWKYFNIYQDLNTCTIDYEV